MVALPLACRPRSLARSGKSRLDPCVRDEPPQGKYGARVALYRVMGFQMQGRFYTGLKSTRGTGPGKRRGNPMDWVFQTRPNSFVR